MIPKAHAEAEEAAATAEAAAPAAEAKPAEAKAADEEGRRQGRQEEVSLRRRPPARRPAPFTGGPFSLRRATRRQTNHADPIRDSSSASAIRAASTRHAAQRRLLVRRRARGAARRQRSPREAKFHGDVAKAGGDLRLLKPATFMNLSGRAVAALARFYAIAPAEILVVHDELDLPPGEAKLKFGGGIAGHNGLRDIRAQTRDRRLLAAAPRHRPPARFGGSAAGRRRLRAATAARRRAALDRGRDRPGARRLARRSPPATTSARCWHSTRKRNHEPQMRHRRPAQRRQVDPLQRADQGGHRRRELSVLHDRAQRRHRRGARSAPRGARRDRASREKVLPATVEFVDIAGLVAGASKGEGLGNQFLANIRETDAIAHVVRCFVDENVVHVAGKVDPVSDIETINTELALADLATVEKQLVEVRRRSRAPAATRRRSGSSPCWRRCEAVLDQGRPARTADLYAEEKDVLKPFFLLTMKPTMYVANVAEHGFHDNPLLAAVETHAAAEGAPVVAVCAALEAEIADLDGDDKRGVPRRPGPRRAGPRPRDPRRLQAARPADLLHRRAEGGARVDHSRRATRRRRRPASSTPTSRRASSAPR